MRKNIVAGNWKMNKTLDEGLQLTSEVVNMVRDEVNSEVQVVLAPPFIHITSVQKLASEQANVLVSAQNCYHEESGAYTGEVSAAMIKSTGAEYVIIGHSERREYFNESDEQLATKVDLALANDLIPIFCCGESLEIRESGSHFDFVTQQVTNSLFHLSEESFNKIVIAYEPIWAIGTGKTASSEQAQEMHASIRAHVANQYRNDVAAHLSILYGGSCKPSNAPELFACADVDGGLIGGASLNARDFVDIAKSF